MRLHRDEHSVAFPRDAGAPHIRYHHRTMRSVFAPVLLPLLALAGAVARWVTQGSGNLYTAVAKRFYVPDPDLGWRIAPQTPVWLGLEVCAVILAVTVGLVVAALLVRRRERRRGRPARVLRGLGWLVAGATLAVPVAAFASGGAPAGARDQIPAADAVKLEAGISGALAAPAGTYEVVTHPGSAVTAQLKAGGEAFDARLGDVRGTWTGDPGALASPVHAEISVAADTVDTGITERSKHAREAYLLSDKYPRITFTLGNIIAARSDAPGSLAFHAAGTLGLIGKTHVVDVTGTIARPDAAGLARLGLTGDILLVKATFSVPIRETALAPDAGDFDGDRIPILVSLVLRHTSG